MYTGLFSLALLATTASAEAPLITWDAANDGVPVHTNGPVARNWSWTCDDPSDQFPITQKCRVYDVTDGIPGSGLAVILDDVVCNQGSTDPAVVNYDYDVLLPEEGHKYYYQARCIDGVGNLRSSTKYFTYDETGPVIDITTGPADTNAADVDFEFTCADGSFGYDYSPSAHVPVCNLTCALYDDSTGTEISAPSSCDTFNVSADTDIATHALTGLAPATYRLEVFGTDSATNAGSVTSWTWEVIADADDDGIIDGEDNCINDANADQLDGDVDGQGDVCDICPLDATDDTDGDGVCDGVDLCVGEDTTGDTDNDGVCDDLDACVGFDDALDADGDGLCDALDLCPNSATDDADGDGICDDLDLCEGDDATGDSDLDGLCDDVDLCLGDNDSGDTDADGVCDDIDGCSEADADGDNICDDLDLCTGLDSSGDADGDGFCAADIDDSDLDCDDNNDTVYPGAMELCDGLDNACAGAPPLEDIDDDGDGMSICEGDCDDTDLTRYAGAPEECDGVDNNCDDILLDDEFDDDGDGWLLCTGDCDDFNQSVRPEILEVCGDGIDNNCNNNIDEDCALDNGTLTGDGVKGDGGGCGCQTPGGSGSWPVFGLMMLLLGRRRR